ncbi:MAG: phosphoglucomutase (alpha-D-glucose-1,6-bisphosphate-dependent) [Halioglobus sp.]
MSPHLNPMAGTFASQEMLVDVPRLIAEYYAGRPDPAVAAQRIAFGTSGHRGSSFECSFNEAHVLAMTQAICSYRKQQAVPGPLFLGFDTHALSAPAFASALEVLAANGIDVMIAERDEYTPTPAISHAILVYNRGRKSGLADGIVITPSHNPPDSGGFKYNPSNGGPADTDVTGWIETEANRLLTANLAGVKRMPLARARKAATTHCHDYLNRYVADLGNVVDMAAIRNSGIRIGVDPMGGAGVHYWSAIAGHYGLDLTVVNESVDPTFRFVTLDWDGKIRMDPSSAHAMQSLIELKDRYDIAFACDTDHDRHGIVTPSAGLLPPNHYLSVAIYYLFQHRPLWSASAGIGKTVVSSQMIDRVAAKLQRRLYEVPVGFKWFVDGLLDGSLGFVGEESAGAAFSRIDGTVWTTDKDGITAALLSAEITACMGRDPGEIYAQLTGEFGDPQFERIDAPASPSEKKILSRLAPEQVISSELGGQVIQSIITRAPGNNAAIGGLKVSTAQGWFAARPSGTENVYKIYAESYLGAAHLRQIQKEAQSIVSGAIAAQS